MNKNTLVPYVSDEDLYKIVKDVIDRSSKDKDLYKNALDPFSALFDSLINNLSYNNWIKNEKMRQRQKTLQNVIGIFHQKIISSIDGWENIDDVFDVENKDKKIIAEIKNKYNTIKGSDKVYVYNSLKDSLRDRSRFTAYVVEIIPEHKNIYNRPFVPSDNINNNKIEKREDIRVIDGKSFYALASGYNDALKLLYLALPKIICDILGTKKKSLKFINDFENLFDNTF